MAASVFAPAPSPKFLFYLTDKKASCMSALFTPFQLKSVTLRNRIAIPPMCQYSAVD
eukprot:gene26351-47640_t